MASKKKKPAKSEKPEPKLPEFNERIELKYEFSEHEKAGLLQELSRKHEEKEQLTAQAKSSQKQWKGKIEEATLKINELSMKGRDGFEMRPTDVRVVLDKKKGKKFVYCKTSGALLEEREMSDYDYERLPMEIPPAKDNDDIKPDDGLTKVADAFPDDDGSDGPFDTAA